MLYKKISVVGLGYIGLPTAAVFASKKVNVIGLDVNSEVVSTINKGEIHIVEPDLDVAVHAAVKEGYLTATTQAEPADAFLIAVPTPFKEDHQPDLRYIESACKSIAPVLKKGDLVILESTSPVGATEQMAQWLSESRPDLTFPLLHGEDSDIRVAHCPERVLPGQVLRELVLNDRVIGGVTNKCSLAAASLYKIFLAGDCFLTNARTAEMCKLTENSFRDVNIAFANELSLISDKLDINVWELIRLANRHPRVNILQPGPGVGGHCIAVDPWFIVSSAPEEAKLIRTAREVNDSKPEWVIKKIKESLADWLIEYPERTVKDIEIAVFGIAFKPDIDDLRESPSLEIARRVANEVKENLLLVEPNIDKLPEGLGTCRLTEMNQAISMADIIVMLVDHKPFKMLKVKSGQRLVDTRGVFE